jgi:hypothetical protein
LDDSNDGSSLGGRRTYFLVRGAECPPGALRLAEVIHDSTQIRVIDINTRVAGAGDSHAHGGPPSVPRQTTSRSSSICLNNFTLGRHVPDRTHWTDTKLDSAAPDFHRLSLACSVPGCAGSRLLTSITRSRGFKNLSAQSGNLDAATLYLGLKFNTWQVVSFPIQLHK